MYKDLWFSPKEYKSLPKNTKTIFFPDAVWIGVEQTEVINK